MLFDLEGFWLVVVCLVLGVGGPVGGFALCQFLEGLADRRRGR